MSMDQIGDVVQKCQVTIGKDFYISRRPTSKTYSYWTLTNNIITRL